MLPCVEIQSMENQRKQSKEHRRSSTLDILGGASSPTRKHPDRWSAHSTALSEYRERLLSNRCSQSKEAKQEIAVSGEHMADAGTDSYDRDRALAMASSAQSILYEIDEALHRIQTGCYGKCELTGEPIERERLKAIPWTRFSARAQAELESRGAGTRVHLGKLGSYAQVQSESEGDSEDSEPTEAEMRQAA